MRTGVTVRATTLRMKWRSSRRLEGIIARTRLIMAPSLNHFVPLSFKSNKRRRWFLRQRELLRNLKLVRMLCAIFWTKPSMVKAHKYSNQNLRDQVNKKINNSTEVIKVPMMSLMKTMKRSQRSYNRMIKRNRQSHKATQ